MRSKPALCTALLLLGACQLPPLAPDPFAEQEPPVILVGASRVNNVDTKIMLAGQRFEVGAPVVLWFEDPKYDAYASGPRFSKEEKRGLRYQPGRTPRTEALAREVEREGWSLENLRAQVDQLVLHYDVCGTSRTCFKVLQDLRQLSVHFLLDVDGTIYQTLDLKEQAWHASEANPRSIGIEIAHIGAYPLGQPSPLDTWYPSDALGPRLQLPAELGNGGVRTPGFRGRPARREKLVGRIQGESLQQFDFTPEQYDSLARLSAGLARALPGIRLDAPRGPAGEVRSEALSAAELASFGGILGHYHVSPKKIDPGPALDWERLLQRARAHFENP